MSIDPVNMSGWAFGEKLTSAQMNDFNDKITFALDNREDALDVEPVAKIIPCNGTYQYPAASWSSTSGGVLVSLSTAGVSVDYKCDLLPHGCLITGWFVSLKASPAHGAHPVGTMPAARLYKIDNGGTATAIGAAASDASANNAAYEVVHGITKTGLGETVDRETYRYFLQVTDETGANAFVGNAYYAAGVSVEIEKLWYW